LEADLFRGRLYKYWDHIGVNYTSHEEYYMLPEYLNRTALDQEGNDLLDSLQNTLIWRKMTYTNQVYQWFYFDENATTDSLPWKHPYKLLQLEMWCRVSTYDSRKKSLNHALSDDLCNRKSNVIATQQYF
jgi:hypothetical protein